MRSTFTGNGHVPPRRIVVMVACIALVLPSALPALGSKESAKASDGAAIRLAAAPPYAAPPESGDSWTSTVPSALGPAPDGAFPGAASEAGKLELDIDRAVELALANNIGLASSRIDSAAKQRKVDTSWNVFVPTVDISGTMARMNVPTVVTFPTTYELPQWSASGSLSASLMLNVALFEGIRNLKLDYEAGLITYAQARLRLERDVRKSYYSILLLQDSVSLMEENLAAAERRVGQAQANYLAGLAPELTFLQARVAAANMKPALEELRNAVSSSMAGFALNLGLPRGTAMTLADARPPVFVELDANGLLDDMVAGRLEIQGLLKSIELVESARKLAFFQIYSPTLALGLSFDPTFQGDPTEDSWFKDEGWKQRSGMFRATLTYRLNGLVPLTKEALSLVELEESREKLRIALAQSIRGMETELDAIVLKLDKARKGIDALQLNVLLAEQAYALAEDAYKSGALPLVDVQNSELELRKARNEVLKEKFNYMTGLLDLEYAVGVPFGTLARRLP